MYCLKNKMLNIPCYNRDLKYANRRTRNSGWQNTCTEPKNSDESIKSFL